MLTLGIETSCDDTSIAVLRDESDLLSNVVSSQLEHSQYGGIVPELASRAHVQNIVPVFRWALGEAGVEPEELDLIGVTNTPGLIGSLMVGGAFAQALALALELPIVPVHHIEAHIVANLLEYPDLELPAVALVVSGGHSSLIHVPGWRQYEVMGTTRDDAAGEAFDKVAKLLGLGFPGGPEIEQLALKGDPRAIPFRRPGRKVCKSN
jgi:N6-L-threonylcarbamoyladenine synthase